MNQKHLLQPLRLIGYNGDLNSDVIFEYKYRLVEQRTSDSPELFHNSTDGRVCSLRHIVKCCSLLMRERGNMTLAELLCPNNQGIGVCLVPGLTKSFFSLTRSHFRLSLALRLFKGVDVKESSCNTSSLDGQMKSNDRLFQLIPTYWKTSQRSLKLTTK